MTNVNRKPFVYFVVFCCALVFTSYQNPPNELVKAELSKEERDVPIYGFNGNNTDGPSWTDKQFRDSVVSLGLKAIRYPGGSIANYWDWQNGWFEKSSSFATEQIARKQNRQFVPTRLNELKLLVDDSHCDVVFVLNMVTRSLTDQINMLKHAQSIGIPVKWVELGNEFYAPESIAWKKFKSLRDYGDTCKQWITSIKNEFPNVKAAVIGGNAFYNNDVKEWNSIVLQRAPNADAITFHDYINNSIADNSGINFEKLYSRVKFGFEQRGFDKIKDKEIWVTEYNIHWATGNPKDNLKVNKDKQQLALTWSQALSIVLLTSRLTEMSDHIKMLLDHNITSSPVFAAIDTRNNSIQKLPNGIGMQAWLSASNNMKLMQKISFSDGNGADNNSIKDFQMFGWKFSNNNKNNFLIVNLSDAPTKIDLSSLNINKNSTFETQYGEKNQIIKSNQDVHVLRGNVVDAANTELPKYSITVIKNG